MFRSLQYIRIHSPPKFQTSPYRSFISSLSSSSSSFSSKLLPKSFSVSSSLTSNTFSKYDDVIDQNVDFILHNHFKCSTPFQFSNHPWDMNEINNNLKMTELVQNEMINSIQVKIYMHTNHTCMHINHFPYMRHTNTYVCIHKQYMHAYTIYVFFVWVFAACN